MSQREVARTRRVFKEFIGARRRNNANTNNRYDDKPYRGRVHNQGGRYQHFQNDTAWNHHGATAQTWRKREETKDSSDEEAETEKRKAATIIKNRLMSLSDEYKEKSMKQLIDEGTQNKSSTSVVQPTESEKQARRIAHVRKPIKPSLPFSNPSHSNEINYELVPSTAAPARKTPKKQVMQNLMQDLITKSQEDLKRLATAPKSNEIAIFQRLTAIHRSQMSEAMRKLAEHKLQLENDSSPQLLAELEQLVQPDMAIDMYNMPLETVQCLQEIFNFSLTGEDQSAALPIPKTEVSANYWMDSMVNGSSFQLGESFPSPSCEATNQNIPVPKADTPVNRISSSVPKKTKGKKSQPLKIHTQDQESQTDVQNFQEMSSQTDQGEIDSSNGKLLSELHSLFTVLDSSCDESSRILKSTAINCISALVQNFTKQFSELNSNKKEEPVTFLDPGGTIKRIRISSPYQSLLQLPATAQRPGDVTTTVAPAHEHGVMLSLLAPNSRQENFQVRNSYTGRNDNFQVRNFHARHNENFGISSADQQLTGSRRNYSNRSSTPRRNMYSVNEL